MDAIFAISLFWSIYGIAGVFGFQIIPAKYKGHDWTRSYVRSQGVSWLLLGVPWLIFNRAAAYFFADAGAAALCLILLVLAMPSIIFSFFNDRKYRSMLNGMKSE